MGHNLHFLHIETETSGDRKAMHTTWGRNFHYLPYVQPSIQFRVVRRFQRLFKDIPPVVQKWYDPAFDKIITKLQKTFKFDVVIVEYVFFAKALDCFGQDVLKVIDTLDVFSNRHQRMMQQDLQPSWYSVTPREEAQELERADVVIAISEEDRQALSQLVSRKVITVGHIVPVCQPSEVLLRSGKILFVGSGNPMNVQAVQFFVNQVLPSVKLRCPAVQLLIAGTVCDLLEADGPYRKLGRVEDLQSVYADADVVINPMLFGTGLSIKSLEALGYARPLVTTSVGARGLSEAADRAFLIADTPEAFSAAVINVLTEGDLSLMLSRNASEFALQWNQQNLRALEDLLNA